MEASMQQRISKFINDVQSIAPKQAEIVASIRGLFNKANQALSEEIKYGGLVFLKSIRRELEQLQLQRA